MFQNRRVLKANSTRTTSRAQLVVNIDLCVYLFLMSLLPFTKFKITTILKKFHFKKRKSSSSKYLNRYFEHRLDCQTFQLTGRSSCKLGGLMENVKKVENLGLEDRIITIKHIAEILKISYSSPIFILTLADPAGCPEKNNSLPDCSAIYRSKLDFTKAYNLGVSIEAAEKDSAAVEQQLRSGTDSKGVECQIEVEHNFTVEVHFSEVRCTDDEESVTSNQDKPAKSNKEKKLTRKRKLNKNEWRCKKNKKLKNSGEAYEGCNSRKRYPKKSLGPTCTCKKGCSEKFSSSERQRIFDHFYSLVDRELQWLYLSKNVKTDTIKRMTLERKNNRTQTLKYHFPLNDEDVLVCKNFFLNTLQIGEQMVYTALEKVKLDEGFKDNRGVHNNRPRKMNTTTEFSIKTHIELFPKVESHYTRKTSKREYLSGNLNISKMYRFYSEWFANQNYNDVKMATKRQYETVFNTNYNYSFFKPKKDQCPSCSLFEQADPLVKASLEEKHKCHLERKEIIRKIKKEEIDTADKNSSTVAIFDLQKVLSIPQSEVSIFHYKRKYPVYNFTVFDALRKKGYCYVWHFQIAKRGSTEIGSALLHFFKTNCENGITTFSLYSDGCYGQNKNRYIFALYVYAAKLLCISISHRFFETGHSQNEGDSMHACIERNLKNKVVYTPDQIYNIILNSRVTGEKYCVKELEQSDIYDIKQLVEPHNWRRDKDGEIIHWADVMEVKTTHLQENKLFFRYNFEDAYSELDTNPQSTLNIRRRGRKRTQVTPIVLGNIELQQAYHQPIPITKALHTDLMSLCKSGAIPRFYHPFYDSLSFTDNVDARDKNEESNC
ncbi:hypothetical protein K1T71_013969 [Dendrolimus kikuchii]|uniref:Uncharacterized protein n=1 Tax=Dendrolimus kikuchii TaxID=765133 RepID=A0ACC1CG90_9NEOP|nr:hypothetical protein K1T71_013969 [Dendrolimus kikuchii]